MPIYQYRCTVCGHQFDVMQTMSDPPVLQCEQCGKPVRKVISSSGLVFKGSGWYVTDYGTRKKDEPAKTETKTERPSAPGGAEPGASEKKTVPADSKKDAPASTTSPAPPQTDPPKHKPS